jgi:hypothetical protein
MPLQMPSSYVGCERLQFSRQTYTISDLGIGGQGDSNTTLHIMKTRWDKDTNFFCKYFIGAKGHLKIVF